MFPAMEYENSDRGACFVQEMGCAPCSRSSSRQNILKNYV